MMNLLANVNPADVIAFAKAVPTPSDYMLTREIVPETQIQNVKYRIKTTSRFRGTAKFRAYDTESPLGRREVSHSITEGMLPPVGQKLTVGELETILLSLERGADDQELVDAIYDDAETDVLAIKARMELAAGDLLVDGKFTLTDENGLTLEADFGVPAGFKPTAGVYWSDTANATPLSDEQGWNQYLIDNGDGAVGDRLASNKVVSLLAKAHEYQEAYFGRGQATYPTLTPNQVNSVRSSYGLPNVRIYDTQVRVDGVNQRVIPDNLFFMLPTDKSSFAETQYGITAEALALSRQGNPRIERVDLPGIYVTVSEQDDPVRVWTKGTAVAMPVLYAPKSYIAAKVLA